MDLSRRTFCFAAGAAALALRDSAAGAPAREVPFRQIHLDFHTSELIPDIGADFNADEFISMLEAAHVNSINVFAKDHHGYAFYDTKIATPHPHLKKDLLGEMTRACKRRAITVNYYYSLVWDVLQAREHPEWLALDREGKRIGGPPTTAWPWLCMNSPYFDKVLAENREIVEKYEVDGAWFDILKQPPEGCWCQYCRDERERLGLTRSEADIARHNKLVALRVEKALHQLTREKFPNAATFFNSRLVIGVRDELPYYSHIELESLPTGGWGYSHFQQRVRYYRTLGKELVGMTGRFHKSWGDFGGLKNQAALDYECLNFVANGAKVCVGDQLHPRGRLDRTTYARIGRTYEKVKALEPWARGARPVADIGVMSTAAVDAKQTTKKIPPSDQGFTNMLLELHHQFDILDYESDLSRYRLLIFPDEIRATPELVAKVRKYLASGGALIASHDSLADTDLLGVRVAGPSKYAGEYMLLKKEAFPAVEENAWYLYQRGKTVEALPDTEVLATYGHPYFDRSPEGFSSHAQTPLGTATEEPLITRRGNVIYIANPFFRSYSEDGYGVQKLVVSELIRKLMLHPTLDAPNLPSTAQVTLLQQASRVIVHVLYYPLTRRAPDIDIIEEPGLLEDVTIRIRTPDRPTRVVLVPQGQEIPFRHGRGYASFEIPRVLGHQAVSVETCDLQL